MIDKHIGLSGTVYTAASIFVSHLCTIYHQNKRFENIHTCIHLLVLFLHGTVSEQSTIVFFIWFSCSLLLIPMTLVHIDLLYLNSLILPQRIIAAIEYLIDGTQGHTLVKE